MISIEIIASSSKGNCFLYNENIIVDCGIPMKLLKEKVDLSKIGFVLLTHLHSDHFNKSTIRNIIQNHKHIKFYFADWMMENMRLLRVDNFEVIRMNRREPYMCGDVSMFAFDAIHDIQNNGYRFLKDGYKCFHATDIGTLYGLTALNYDTATIECNHHRETALKLIEEKAERGEYSHLIKALDNHLDVVECVDFVKANKIKKLIPVHIGDSTMVDVEKYIKEML